MSYINSPGLTSATCKMITRQQISDVLSYNQIITNPAAAKRTQIQLEKLITLAKKDNVVMRRRAAAILIKNKKFSHAQLMNHLFKVIAPKYLTRPGGYSRLLKLSASQGDNSTRCLLQLV